MKFQSGSQTVWTTGRRFTSIARLQNCSIPVQVWAQQASLHRCSALQFKKTKTKKKNEKEREGERQGRKERGREGRREEK